MVLTAKLRKTDVSPTTKILKIPKNQTGVVILCHKLPFLVLVLNNIGCKI